MLMQKGSKENNSGKLKRKHLSERLSNYREVFVCMAWRVGLTGEEVAEIFGTTKQNVAYIVKKEKSYGNN